MKAAIDNPLYYVSLLTKKGTVKYDITPIIETLKISDSDGELATVVTASFPNIQVEGAMLNTLFVAGDVIQVQADNGNGKKTVGTFTIWDKDYESSNKKSLSVTGYDSKLIYLQKSEDVQFFTKGKSTDAIISAICKAGGGKQPCAGRDIWYAQQRSYSKSDDCHSAVKFCASTGGRAVSAE